MTAAQPELFPPPRENKNLAWLESFLKDHPAWYNAHDLVAAIFPGSIPGDNLKRQIRELAAASRWIISGQKGYKHLDHATPEETHHFVSWMESQAREMTRRAESIRKNAHRIFG